MEKTFNEYTIDNFSDNELDGVMDSIGAAKFFAIYLRYIAHAFELPVGAEKHRKLLRANGVFPALYAYCRGSLAALGEPVDLGARQLELVDGEERHRLHPETFELPSEEERKNMPVGAYVKLGFSLIEENGLNTERMWVLIKDKEEVGYTGILSNNPVGLPLHSGETIAFEPKHILSVMEVPA